MEAATWKWIAASSKNRSFAQALKLVYFAHSPGFAALLIIGFLSGSSLASADLRKTVLVVPEEPCTSDTNQLFSARCRREGPNYECPKETCIGIFHGMAFPPSSWILYDIGLTQHDAYSLQRSLTAGCPPREFAHTFTVTHFQASAVVATLSFLGSHTMSGTNLCVGLSLEFECCGFHR